MDHHIQGEAARVIIRALNVMLEASGANYRATGDLVITRTNGHVVIAIPTIAHCPPPIINLWPKSVDKSP